MSETKFVLVPEKATAEMVSMGNGITDFVLPAFIRNTKANYRHEMRMAWFAMVKARPASAIDLEQAYAELEKAATFLFEKHNEPDDSFECGCNLCEAVRGLQAAGRK